MISTYDIQTPTLLFPALSLLILAYTNRFLGITQVIRNLHADLVKNRDNDQFYIGQINSLSQRIKLIIHAQHCGIISLMLCVISMFSLLVNKELSFACFFGALSMLFLSLIFLAKELNVSQHALNYILEDCKNVRSKI